MDDWQIDFEWLRARNFVKTAFELDKLPDLQAILMLVGIQEAQQIRDDYTKEEKQDLMHVAVCALFALDNYYELEGYDGDGWPHYKLIEPLPYKDIKSQEDALKVLIIRYLELDTHEKDVIQN
jgi:hypothetical protein